MDKVKDEFVFPFERLEVWRLAVEFAIGIFFLPFASSEALLKPFRYPSSEALLKPVRCSSNAVLLYLFRRSSIIIVDNTYESTG